MTLKINRESESVTTLTTVFKSVKGCVPRASLCKNKTLSRSKMKNWEVKFNHSEQQRAHTRLDKVIHIYIYLNVNIYIILYIKIYIYIYCTWQQHLVKLPSCSPGARPGHGEAPFAHQHRNEESEIIQWTDEGNDKERLCLSTLLDHNWGFP